jgi:hypothetical protein
MISHAAKKNKTAAMARQQKGNTLLNYCGVCTDLIDYTVDRSPHKRSRCLGHDSSSTPSVQNQTGLRIDPAGISNRDHGTDELYPTLGTICCTYP